MRHQHSRQNTLRHDGPQQHRKATTGRSIQKFRMQFPQHRIAPHIHIVGIATFVETVESSPALRILGCGGGVGMGSGPAR